jgi:hypothetical protein
VFQAYRTIQVGIKLELRHSLAVSSPSSSSLGCFGKASASEGSLEPRDIPGERDHG